MFRSFILASAFALMSAPAFASADAVPGTPLPAPGVFGLVAAGVIGAILVARRKK